VFELHEWLCEWIEQDSDSEKTVRASISFTLTLCTGVKNKKTGSETLHAGFPVISRYHCQQFMNFS
jgi:hypothetical protein